MELAQSVVSWSWSWLFLAAPDISFLLNKQHEYNPPTAIYSNPNARDPKHNSFTGSTHFGFFVFVWVHCCCCCCCFWEANQCVRVRGGRALSCCGSIYHELVTKFTNMCGVVWCTTDGSCSKNTKLSCIVLRCAFQFQFPKIIEGRKRAPKSTYQMTTSDLPKTGENGR